MAICPIGLPIPTWAKIDARASGAVRIAHDRLYAAFKTDDPDALTNAGSDPVNLFKYGGALDIMIGTEADADKNRQEPTAGDLRLLVTRVKGKTKAMLYRAIVPGTSPESRVLFASPVGKVAFDQVTDVSEKVELAEQGGNYEVSVPLSALEWSPKTGETIAGRHWTAPGKRRTDDAAGVLEQSQHAHRQRHSQRSPPAACAVGTVADTVTA